jgi:hypothetical protein
MDGTRFTGLPIAWLVHKIKQLGRKPKFHYRAHKNLPIYIVRQMYRLHTLTCSTPEIHLRLGLPIALCLSDFPTDILCAYLISTTEFWYNNVSSKSLGNPIRPSFRVRPECTSTQTNGELVYFHCSINKNKTMSAVWRPSPKVYVSLPKVKQPKSCWEHEHNLLITSHLRTDQRSVKKPFFAACYINGQTGAEHRDVFLLRAKVQQA